MLVYIPFNSISVIQGQWEGDHKQLCEMEPHLWLKWFPPPAGIEPETVISANQPFTQLWLATFCCVMRFFGVGEGGGGQWDFPFIIERFDM